jgi:ribosome-binding factor A
MGSIRVGRVREKVKTEVARILQTQMSDPRMGFITVTDCDLTADFRYAKIKVSVMADKDAEVRRVMRMLSDATGYVQGILAGRLRTRVTPALTFVLDKGVEQSVKISGLLDELRREREEREAAQAPAEDGADSSDDADGSDDEDSSDDADGSDDADSSGDADGSDDAGGADS